MAENNDFTHLPLPLLFQGKPKLRPGRAGSAQTKRNTANRIAHGGYVKRRSAELSRFGKSVVQNAQKTPYLKWKLAFPYC